MTSYETIETGGAPVKAWVRGVPLEDQARQQLINVASLPFVHSHVAAMPDVHWSLGATVGLAVGLAGTQVVARMYPDFPVAVPSWSVALALAVAMLTGLVFGVLPARRAAEMDPIDALSKR